MNGATPLAQGGTASRIDAAPSNLMAKAKELEGLFINTLVSQMFTGIDARGAFGGGYAEETWRSMQAEQYAGMIAGNGGVGLADEIVSSLLAVQQAYQSQQQDQPLAEGSPLP